jgi:uncharacterized protein (TIGR02231 family)
MMGPGIAQDHRRRCVRTAAALALLAAGRAAAGTVPARDGRIVEVTVFRDRAEVVREARVELTAGASTVEFANMPFGVEPDSLRVSATGVPATLGAVEILDRAETPRDSVELSAARAALARVEREIAALDRAQDIDKELRTFLTSIRAATAEEASRRLAEGRADPEAISGLYGVLEGKLRDLAEAGGARDERRVELRDELEVARAKLATVRPPADIRSRVATVEVEARSAGVLTLRLAYVAPGAAWRPTYRATLDAATGGVNLVSEGVVRQATGEDWPGVALRLSTASPARGVEPPLLAPWLLRPAVVAQEGYADVASASPRVYQNVLKLVPGAAAPESDEPAEIEEAGLVRSAYNVAFEVPGGSDVPADGRDHRVVLRSESLAGRPVYRTVPALAPLAYLTSVTTSPVEYPLLAGPVRVFAGGAYLGAFPLEEKGPGVELTLPFGVDNRLEVVRVPLPRSAGREGLTGKQRVIEYAFRTTVQNLQERTVTIVVEDRLPVSEDTRIEVEIGRETTPGFADSERRPGVMLWTLDLAPKEKREIVLAYSVGFPRDLYAPGIGDQE